MWQLWRTHDRGNAANCLSDSLTPTAGPCRRGRIEARGGSQIRAICTARDRPACRWCIHYAWVFVLAVHYWIKVSRSVWALEPGWVAFSCLLASCCGNCVCLSALTSIVSTPICSPAERSKFPSLRRYSYLSNVEYMYIIHAYITWNYCKMSHTHKHTLAHCYL